jgi:hypothetical protein
LHADAGKQCITAQREEWYLSYQYQEENIHERTGVRGELLLQSSFTLLQGVPLADQLHPFLSA